MEKININLQLFAEEEPVEETQEEINFDDIDFEVEEGEEDGVQEENQEIDEETNEEILLDNAEDNPIDDKTQKGLLKALQVERKKRQALESDPEIKKAKLLAEKLAKNTGKSTDEILQQLDEYDVQAATAQYVSEGMDAKTAARLAAHEKRLADMEKSMKQQMHTAEIMSMRTDPRYSDIDLVLDEVKELSGKTGLSLKQAYNALYADKKGDENAKLAAQQAANNLKKKQSAGIAAVNSGGAGQRQTKTNLSKDEQQIAKMMGMSPAVYAALKTGKSIDDYEKLKSKKG